MSNDNPIVRKDRIRMALDALITEGVITDYSIQSNMPGLRWVLYGLPFYGTGRAYSTAGMEAFLDGVSIMREATVPWNGTHDRSLEGRVQI